MTHQLYNTYSIIKLAAKIKIHYMTDVVLSAAFDKKRENILHMYTSTLNS